MPSPETATSSPFPDRRVFGYWLPLTALAVGLAFAVALAHFLALRFRAGDIYPAYSSLRSDPLGCRALYEALDRLDGVTAARHFGREGDLPDGPGVTVFRLGISPIGFGPLKPGKPEDDAPKEWMPRTGSRLVVALNGAPEPRSRSSASSEDKEPEKTEKKSEEQTDAPRETSSAETPPKASPGSSEDEAFWPGIFLGREVNPVPDPADAPWRFSDPICRRAPGFTEQGPEETIPCRPGGSLELLDPAWSPVYARDGRPVVAWKSLGGGTVVVLAESFVLSNETLARERRPGFLAWLAGPGTRMIFDETHFGLRETRGVASLGRQYGLEGLAAGLLVLALLFVWKNGFPLVPPRSTDGDRVIRSGGGIEPSRGMVRLLRRHVPETELLSVCFSEWRRLAATAREKSAMGLFETEVLRYAGDPVAGYHRMRYLLSPGMARPGRNAVPGRATASTIPGTVPPSDAVSGPHAGGTSVPPSAEMS